MAERKLYNGFKLYASDWGDFKGLLAMMIQADKRPSKKDPGLSDRLAEGLAEILVKEGMVESEAVKQWKAKKNERRAKKAAIRQAKIDKSGPPNVVTRLADGTIQAVAPAASPAAEPAPVPVESAPAPTVVPNQVQSTAAEARRTVDEPSTTSSASESSLAELESFLKPLKKPQLEKIAKKHRIDLTEWKNENNNVVNDTRKAGIKYYARENNKVAEIMHTIENL